MKHNLYRMSSDGDDYDMDSSSDSEDEEPWIEWLIKQPGYNYLCEIDRTFIGKKKKTKVH